MLFLLVPIFMMGQPTITQIIIFGHQLIGLRYRERMATIFIIPRIWTKIGTPLILCFSNRAFRERISSGRPIIRILSIQITTQSFHFNSHPLTGREKALLPDWRWKEVIDFNVPIRLKIKRAGCFPPFFIA